MKRLGFLLIALTMFVWSISAIAEVQFPGSPSLEFNLEILDYIEPVIPSEYSEAEEKALPAMVRYASRVKSMNELAYKGRGKCRDAFDAYEKMVKGKYQNDWRSYTILPDCVFDSRVSDKDRVKWMKALGKTLNKGKKIFKRALEERPKDLDVTRGYLEFSTMLMGFEITNAYLASSSGGAKNVNMEQIMMIGLSEDVMRQAMKLSDSQPKNYKYTALMGTILTGRSFIHYLASGFRPYDTEVVNVALEYVKKGIAQNREHESFDHSYYDLGLLTMIKGGSMKEARKNFLTALKNNPSYSYALQAAVATLALEWDSLSEKGKYGSPNDLLLVARLFWQAGDMKGADSLVADGLKEWPANENLVTASNILKK